MPSWNETAAEIERLAISHGLRAFDELRKSRYEKLEAHTKRPLIVYATDFLNRPKVDACRGQIEIDLSDRDGFIEVTRKLKGRAADVILESPGGLPDAANSLVHILHSRFSDIRFIIAGVAKSAATMMALSGNRLVMHENAELGPIDPQFRLVKGDGTPIIAPAQAIIDQFEGAQQLIAQDPKRLTAWLPILQQYGPALYQQCKNAIQLSKDYVGRYLKTWMFKRFKDREKRADAVVNYLGDHNSFKSHAARVAFKDLHAKGVVVDLLNKDEKFCALVEDVMYALSFTFQNSGAFKLFENSRGDALFRQVPVVQVAPTPARSPVTPPASPPSPQGKPVQILEPAGKPA